MKDLLLDENYDIQFRNGELVTTDDATEQNQQLIIMSQKGEWKEHPLVGVGIRDYILEDGSADDLRREIQEQMEADGMQVNELHIAPDFKVKLDAKYR